jgi:hypothetical protein
LSDWFQTPVDPIDGKVLRPYVAAEVGAIDFGCASFAADARPLCAGRHCLAQLMRQHKRSLILDIEVTAEGEHALAFDFVAEHRNAHQVGFQRQLMPGEQSA